VLFEPLNDIATIITPQLKNHQSILDKIDQGAEKVKDKIKEQTISE
jgi:hypothetical protein